MSHYSPVVHPLRGAAALAVCFYHFCDYSGAFGPLIEESSWLHIFSEYASNSVYAFFVISGYVIPLSMHRNRYQLSMSPRFLLRRLIRMEVPYLVSLTMLLGVAFAFSLKNGEQFHLVSGQLLSHVFYTTSFTDYDWLNPIYWTLALEFQFYVIVSILYLALSSSSSSIRQMGLWAFSFSVFFVDDLRWVFAFAPMFGLGVVLFWLKTNMIDKKAALISCFLLLFMCTVHHHKSAAFACGISALIIALYDSWNRFGHGLGKISYSLYLTHGFFGGNLIYIVNRHCNELWESYALLIGAICASLVGAWVFWKVVEYPSQILSKRMGQFQKSKSSPKVLDTNSRNTIEHLNVF